MYAGANTQRAQKRIFTCVKGKKRSLSLSFFLFCLCRRCCCSNASRVVRFESEEEEEKNNDSEKFFFFTHAKRHKIYCTVLDFFSLSRSRSLRSSSSSSRATTPRERERERERCVSLQKRSSSLVLLNIRVLSLCSFAALNIFYSFSSEKVDKKKRSVVSDFSTGFFDSKSASCLPHLT